MMQGGKGNRGLTHTRRAEDGYRNWWIRAEAIHQVSNFIVATETAWGSRQSGSRPYWDRGWARSWLLINSGLEAAQEARKIPVLWTEGEGKDPLLWRVLFQ
jgi:hypothetical protein